MLSDQECRRLVAAFAACNYTVDAVVELIGEPAHRALARNSTTPAVRRLQGSDAPLATLTRLWLLQQPVPADVLEEALPDLVMPLIEARVLTRDGGLIHARIDIRPYASDDGAGGWIVSDLTPNLDTATAPVRPDFVLGVSPASTTLAQLAVRRPVRRALDLGTGCGVQSLHLARHADAVVATDLNLRALDLATLTARLNGVAIDFRAGDMFGPVAGEQYDLILTNPPYVLSPPSSERLTYREGDRTGDDLMAGIVREGARHLEPGGVLEVLGNWAHVDGEEWIDRLRGWIEPTGCDGYVVQREVLEAAEYVELWLTDAGLAGSTDYLPRYRAWLDYFERLRIWAVGLGWVVLRRPGLPGARTAAEPTVTIEDWPHPVEQPIGTAIADRLDAIDLLRALPPSGLLDHAWALAADVIEETVGPPGAADPSHIGLRQQRGFRRAIAVDTALAGVLGAADGELTLGRIVAAVASVLDTDPIELATDVRARLPQLVLDGFLRLDFANSGDRPK